eukprot:12934336-Prorocentrum_lima.AAC.1
MPTQDLSKTSIARELQAWVAKVPATMVGLATWLEDYSNKLELGMRIGCLLGPITTLRVVNDTMERVKDE